MKSDDEETFRLLREGVKEFLVSLTDYEIDGTILEVGRMQRKGKTYELFPDLFVDTTELFPGNRHIFLDIDSTMNPDICCDIVDIDRHVQPNELGAIILLHVLEHVPRFWVLPEKLSRILKPGGLLFVQTPWAFRFHGPRPDCWRFSDDGYEHLFQEHFDFVRLDKYNPQANYLNPLAISAVLRKKGAG